LYHALLNKCEIANYKEANKYKKIMYLDCDIIVQCDLTELLKNIPIKPDLLYAPAEGTLTGEYWYLNAYKDSNIERLEKDKVKSFNSGTFIFIPTKTFLTHFKNVKKLGETFKGEKHFYDQSFLNYYFNINNLSSTDFITDMVIIFPDPEKFYPNKCILHFAGLGRYMEKSKIMKKYLKMLKLVKKSS
jgi:lipopolysaccharide biosynthesis glycosyltransferase